MLRISWLFCIFRYSPANKVWKPKRGKFSNKDMAKVQNISEIHPTLGFTEFDILEKYRSDSGFCAVRPVRLDRSVKAFVDFIGSSPAQKNKIFCFSEQEKNSLTGGTPHFVRQTPPVGRSETLTGSSFLLQWSSVIKPFISR